MKRFYSLVTIATILLTLCVTTIYMSSNVVESSVNELVYNELDKVPFHNVGLLLGTSKMTRYGEQNLYYKYRLEAAVNLYKNGKIKYILVSGDNGTRYYDEPTTIRKDLVAAGVPKENIYLDYAGFRTLDSVIRSNKIFGQKKITVISQKFHNERALFIAKQNGIDAVGYNAKDVPYGYGVKTELREKLARVKMMVDIFSGKGPKYLGDRVEIGCM